MFDYRQLRTKTIVDIYIYIYMLIALLSNIINIMDVLYLCMMPTYGQHTASIRPTYGQHTASIRQSIFLPYFLSLKHNYIDPFFWQQTPRVCIYISNSGNVIMHTNHICLNNFIMSLTGFMLLG